MRRKALWISLICCLLVVSMSVGVLIWRDDWRYRLGLALKWYPAFQLDAVSAEGWQEMDWDELLAVDGVEQVTYLMLVNEENPLAGDWEPELAVGEGFAMDPVAMEAFLSLQARVQKETGQSLMLTSAYRSAAEQVAVLEQKGDAIAAMPGESEHQTGLALDVCVKWFGGMSFLKTEAGRLVNKICWEYGFVIRYPQGKQEVTGFDYEPWHLRYVGAPHAELMTRHGLTLEEYLEALPTETWVQWEDYYILRTAAETLLLPMDFENCQVSEDRLGYRVLTLQL